MTSSLLLPGVGSAAADRRLLNVREEGALAAATGELVAFAVSPDERVIALEREDEITAAWTREGALRLADLLPPAYAQLASSIRDRHQLPP